MPGERGARGKGIQKPMNSMDSLPLALLLQGSAGNDNAIRTKQS